jgi:hypothetical protein
MSKSAKKQLTASSTTPASARKPKREPAGNPKTKKSDGYLCDRCGPTKSLVVLRSPPLQPMM